MKTLTLFDWGCGLILLTLAWVALMLMLTLSCKMVADDAMKEAEQEAEHRAQILAERRYRQMLENTQIRVRQQLRIVNESDIDWGCRKDDAV